MTIDLTSQELEANLWCIHTIEAAFSHEPPSGTTLASLKCKLLEKAQAAHQKGSGIPEPVAVREGKGW